MAENTVSKSFRLPKIDAVWLQDLAKNTGNTQTTILSDVIMNARLNEGKVISVKAMSGGGITENSEAIDVLGQLGIATASGFAGYHIAGFIRKEFDMDEDKGVQLLVGMITGLAPIIISALRNNK